MYQAGDTVIYGSTGVCLVTEVSVIDAPWAEEGQSYYTLKPIGGSYVVYAPVDSCKVFTRLAISKDEANRLIDTIPSLKPVIYHSAKAQDIVAYCQSYLESHDCADLIELAMSLRAKKQQTGDSGAKFGSVDEKFMQRAEDLLFGELAAALGISRDEVPGYIESRVGVAPFAR